MIADKCTIFYLVKLNYAQGDLDTAIQYYEKSGFTYLEGDEVKRYRILTDNFEFSSFGIGIYYYLDFYKSMIFGLLVLSLFMSVQVSFNYHADDIMT